MASPEKKVNELMDGRFIALHAEDDQEVANEAFKMNNRVALPVVSKTNKLLGIVTIDDVLWVANEEFSEDMQKMGGTEALDEPTWKCARKIFRKTNWLAGDTFFGRNVYCTAMGTLKMRFKKRWCWHVLFHLSSPSGGNTGRRHLH
jgi:magnesium transporter